MLLGCSFFVSETRRPHSMSSKTRVRSPTRPPLTLPCLPTSPEHKKWLPNSSSVRAWAPELESPRFKICPLCSPVSMTLGKLLSLPLPQHPHLLHTCNGDNAAIEAHSKYSVSAAFKWPRPDRPEAGPEGEQTGENRGANLQHHLRINF